MKNLIILLLACSLIACGKKSEPPQTTSSTQTQADWPDLSHAFDAVARNYPHAQKICYDEAWGFFLDYGPEQTSGEKDDGVWHGMFLITWNDMHFHKVSNGTYWMDEIPENRTFTSHADLTGLECKP
jgi:hypothetical protein